MVEYCNSDSAQFELFCVSGDDVVNGVVQACDCPIQNWKLDHSLMDWRKDWQFARK